MEDTLQKLRPTKKQKYLLIFIKNFIARYGYSPSYREIMRGMSYKSVSTVASHIDSLVARGHLVKRKNSARSLEVIANVEIDDAVSEITEEQSKWLIDIVTAKFNSLPGNPSKQELDELYVLTGALVVLGLNEAAESFKSRLGVK